MHYVFEPGFFSSDPVHIAVVVGAVSALVSGIVGVFTVMRGQSFAGLIGGSLPASFDGPTMKGGLGGG